MFDRKEIDPEPETRVYHLSAGRARNRHFKTGPSNMPHPTFLRITHTPHFSLTRSYVSMPPHCQTQSWRLASTQHDSPASFLKVPTCPHRSKSSVSLRIWSGTASLLLAARHPQARLGEVLHRTRLFHLVVLKRRSASLWPTTNRWFFGKASTRSNRLCHLTHKNNRESYSRSKR